MAHSEAPSRNSRPPAPLRADTYAADFEVPNASTMLALAGPGNERLLSLEREAEVAVGQRGNKLHLQGSEANVKYVERVLTELLEVIERGSRVSDFDVVRAIRMLRESPNLKLRDLFEHVVVTAGNGKQVTPKGFAQKRYIQAIRDYDVVFGVGPAGTGKTYLAVAMALEAWRERKVNRIILTRPAVEAGEKLGFLPGDLAEKVNPYLRPLYDALYDMMPLEKVTSLVQRGDIEVAPLAFMRGRTLADSFVILDEAQNTSIAQMKMFLTRLGMRSKAVIAGDVTQIDLPSDTRSGLIDAVDLLKPVEGVCCCYFTEVDVVRHQLVQRIVEAYNRRDEQRFEDTQPRSRDSVPPDPSGSLPG
jgi:phosphate starvation-inducible protein PhoH and related proteins